MRNGRSLRLALSGVAGMALGLAAQALLHAVSPEAAVAPAVVAQAAIAVIPGAVATPLIQLLEHWAMRLLVAGCAAAYLVIGVLAGAWPRFGRLILTVPWLASPLGALLLPATAGTLAPSVLSAALAAAVAVTAITPASGQVADLGRRRLVMGGLALLTLGALGVTFAARGARAAARALAGGPLTLLRPPAAAAPPAPADDPAAVTSADLAPDLTPNPDFYVVDEAIVDPLVDVGSWRLSVDGHVRTAFSITYEELLELPAVEQYQTLECISNPVGGPLISNALWVGVPCRVLLERAGLVDGAVKVAFHSVEGYSSAIPLGVALEPTTLVAFGMNGQALPREHGFPARLLIPGRYGMKQPKWLARLEVTDKDYQGFWETRGWSDEAVVHTMSRLDTPHSHADLRDGGTYAIGGIAYAGDEGVSRVEVSLDGGKTWRDAELGRKYSKLTWRRWALTWTPAKGWYQIRVRAYNDRGILQSENEQDSLPYGATGVHGYQVEVRG